MCLYEIYGTVGRLHVFVFVLKSTKVRILHVTCLYPIQHFLVFWCYIVGKRSINVSFACVKCLSFHVQTMSEYMIHIQTCFLLISRHLLWDLKFKKALFLCPMVLCHSEFGCLPVTVLQAKVSIVISAAISYRQKPNNASLNRDVLLKLWPAFYPNRGRDSACRHKAEHNGVVKYHGVIYTHQNKVATPDKKGICKYCWSRRQHAELLTLWITLDVIDLRQFGHYLHITDALRTQRLTLCPNLRAIHVLVHLKL